MIPMIIGLALLSACSVDVTTDLIPTTEPSTDRIDVPGGVMIPTDSDDADVATLMLEFNDITDEFLSWFQQQTAAGANIATLGEYVAWGYEQEPIMDEILDRMDARLATIETYLGSETLSASDAQLITFLSVARDLTRGHRFQASPETNCLDLIPPTYYDLPGEALVEIPGYLDCFTELLTNPIVAKTVAASEDLPAAYNAVYLAIAEG